MASDLVVSEEAGALAPLIASARSYAAQAKAEATRRAYRASWDRFAAWFGSTPQTCPVRTLRVWLEAAALTDGPLFRPVKGSRVGTSRLGDKAVARLVKRAAEAPGLEPSRLSGHSLRSGLATAAAKAGKSERSIMAQTGPRSAQMVRRYIRDGELSSENAAAGLL